MCHADFYAYVIVILQIQPNTPVLLCSVAGFDASFRVDELSSSMGKQCTSIALGKAVSPSRA